MNRPNRRPRTFAMPIALGLLQGVGLVAALLGDGPLDQLSWATLGLTVLVAAHYGLRRTAAAHIRSGA